MYDDFSFLGRFSVFKTDSLESVQEIKPKIFLQKRDSSTSAMEINIEQKDGQNVVPSDSFNRDEHLIKGKQNE